MNYKEYAELFDKMLPELDFRARASLKEVAQDLYDYAVMHEDLPKEFTAMLNGLAESVGDII